MRLCTTRLVSVLKFLVWLEDGYEAESAETASGKSQRGEPETRQTGSAAESGREPGGEGENAASRKESEPDSAEPWRSAEGDFPAQRSDSAASARGTDGSRGAGGSAPTRGRHGRMSNTVPDGETDFRKSSGSVDGAA